MDVGKDENGKYLQKRFTAKGKDAEKKVRAMMRAVDDGTFVNTGKQTTGDFLKRWLKEYAVPQLGPRTAEEYAGIVEKHLIPGLGKIALKDLKPEHIQAFYANSMAAPRRDGKPGTISPLTVRHFAMCLHRALTHAVKWGLLSRNPADAVDAPRYQRVDMNIMDESDIEKLLTFARSTRYYQVFYLAIFTGLRRSEFCGLKWGDVDLISGQISVSRSIHQLANNTLVFRPTKTVKSRRNIALTPSTSIMLRAHREKQEALKMALCGRSLEDADMVFCNPDFTPLKPDSVSGAWAELAKRAGMPQIRLHDCRHSHASILLKQNVHPKIVSERLGHSSIAITLDVYSTVMPGLQEAAALSFDAAMNMPYNKSVPNTHSDPILTKTASDR
jgi:integrase